MVMHYVIQVRSYVIYITSHTIFALMITLPVQLCKAPHEYQTNLKHGNVNVTSLPTILDISYL